MWFKKKGKTRVCHTMQTSTSTSRLPLSAALLSMEQLIHPMTGSSHSVTLSHHILVWYMPLTYTRPASLVAVSLVLIKNVYT